MTLDTLSALVDCLLAEETTRARVDAMKDIRLQTWDDALCLARGDHSRGGMFVTAASVSTVSTAYRIRDMIDDLRKTHPSWFDPPPVPAPSGEVERQPRPAHMGRPPAGPRGPSEANLKRLEEEINRSAP